MHDSGLAGFWREYEVKEMKQDSSTIAWNAMGDEWFELAQTGEAFKKFYSLLICSSNEDDVEVVLQNILLRPSSSLSLK